MVFEALTLGKVTKLRHIDLRQRKLLSLSLVCVLTLLTPHLTAAHSGVKATDQPSQTKKHQSLLPICGYSCSHANSQYLLSACMHIKGS